MAWSRFLAHQSKSGFEEHSLGCLIRRIVDGGDGRAIQRDETLVQQLAQRLARVTTMPVLRSEGDQRLQQSGKVRLLVGSDTHRIEAGAADKGVFVTQADHPHTQSIVLCGQAMIEQPLRHGSGDLIVIEEIATHVRMIPAGMQRWQVFLPGRSQRESQTAKYRLFVHGMSRCRHFALRSLAICRPQWFVRVARGSIGPC